MTPTELLTPPLYLPKATDRNRTGNLQITNQVLCQLSYGGDDGEGYPSVVASAPGPRKSAAVSKVCQAQQHIVYARYAISGDITAGATP